MRDTLDAFLHAASGRRFILARWDCGRFCGAWLALNRGVDPSLEWAGRYSTKIGLLRLLKRRGGIVEHFDACLAPFGIERADKPQRGDLAIVDQPEGASGAIIAWPRSTGNPWVVVLDAVQGIVLRRLPVLAAWRI